MGNSLKLHEWKGGSTPAAVEHILALAMVTERTERLLGKGAHSCGLPSIARSQSGECNS